MVFLTTSITGKEVRGCAILTMDGFGSRSNFMSGPFLSRPDFVRWARCRDVDFPLKTPTSSPEAGGLQHNA
jgi:hypothetical protein